jgi:pimeloyl-ACP methyl ester carboxylesterase
MVNAAARVRETGQTRRMDYVLLHGTGQGPAGWARLIDALERRGHRAYPVDFPVDQPDLLAEGYARIASAQVGGSVRDPVVVAHSGSGLLLPSVADTLRASHLVWLAAAIPDFAGGSSFATQVVESGAEMVNHEWLSHSRQSVTDPVIGAYFAFHDCDLETLRWAVTTLRLFYPAAVYSQPAPPEPPKPPSTFVLPKADRTLRPDWMRTAARKRLGIEPLEIDGGHSPHVSRPDLVADILDRCHPRT